MKKIKYIGPISAGRVCAGVGLAMGVLIIPFALWGAVSGYAAPGKDFQDAKGWIGTLLFCVWLPLLYGIAGFVTGAIAACIYNILPRRFGSIEVELE